MRKSWNQASRNYSYAKLLLSLKIKMHQFLQLTPRTIHTRAQRQKHDQISAL